MKHRKITRILICALCIMSVVITMTACNRNDSKVKYTGDIISDNDTDKVPDISLSVAENDAFVSSGSKEELDEKSDSKNENDISGDTEETSTQGIASGETSTKEERISVPEAKKADAAQTQVKASVKQEVKDVRVTHYPLTIVDDAGRKIVIKKRPEKLACMSATYLNTIYQIGGTAHIRTDATGGGVIPEGAQNIVSIGSTVNVNVELLLSHQPDLVICQKGLHDVLAAQLVAAKIPTIVIEMKGYEDVINDVRLIGKIVDRQDAAEVLIETMKSRVSSVISRVPSRKNKAVILYATSTSVSVKLDNSIAGDVAKLLGIENIASGSVPTKIGADYAPFSLEAIVAADPDVVLVTTMVASRDQAEMRIRKDFENNPGWNGLRAVKEGRIYYLPQLYFLYNPGLRYDLALEYMAKLVYPEVFGSVD